jgi:F0F1-type ATP synthase assembly protein I
MGDGPGPSWFDLAGMGIVSGMCVAAGVGGGYWLSTVLHAGPWPTFVGLALGLAAATAWTVYKIRSTL